MNKELYKDRITRLQEGMREEELDLMLLFSLENYIYFSGDMRKQSRMMVPQSGDPILFCFHTEKAEALESSWIKDVRTYRAMHEMMLEIMQVVQTIPKDNPRIGLEAGFALPAFLMDRFQVANPTAEVVLARTPYERVRKIKTPDEIELTRQAAKLADRGMEIVQGMIRPGVTEADIALELEMTLRKEGADGFGFAPFVNSGPRSLWLHGMATGRKLEERDLVLVDIAPSKGGYHANISRTFVVGEANDEQNKLAKKFSQMQTEAIRMLKPEVTLHEIEEANESFLDETPYREFYIRGFIHGIGLSFEEFPFPTIFPEDILAPLEAGMTLSAGHPVLAVPGVGGYKQEDPLLLTDKGAEKLTSFPDGLIEVQHA